MPKIFEINGYKIFFYSKENNEPCHVHITKDYKSVSKVWIEPEIKVAHNSAQIPHKDLKNILDILKVQRKAILQQWNKFFSK